MADRIVQLPDGRVVAFPDSMSDQDIAAAIERDIAQEPPLTLERRPAGAPSAAERMAADAPGEHPHAQVARLVRENLPAIGAAGAAALTGGTALLPIAGAAALGGAGGRLVQQQAEQGLHVPSGEDVASAATTGATEGALQLAGGAASRGAARTGRALYERALGMTPSLTKQFGGRAGRHAIVQAGMEEGIVPGTSRAAGVAEAATGRAAGEARAALQRSPGARQMAAQNVRVRPQYVARGLDKLRTEVAGRPRANVAKEAVDKFEADFLASHPRAKTLDELVSLKQAAAKEGSAAYRAAATDRMAAMEAEANQAIADRARRIIEQVAPETRAANARTQSRIGLTRALEDLEARGPRSLAFDLLLAGGAAGAGNISNLDPTGGVAAAALPLVLRSPRAMGTTGVALHRLTGGGVGTGQVPANLVRAAQIALLASHEPEPQP